MVFKTGAVVGVRVVGDGPEALARHGIDGVRSEIFDAASRGAPRYFVSSPPDAHIHISGLFQ